MSDLVTQRLVSEGRGGALGTALHHLEQARSFLLSEAQGGAAPAERVGAVCVQRSQHGAERLELLRRERPTLPCALLLGEFKAGKSTLINALMGRKVAAVDVFEMTHAVCRLVPIQDGSERVELRAENTSAPTLHLSVEDFLHRCEQRTLGTYTRSVAYVRSALDLILIDTPGLGATQSHERDAMAALTTADICLYIVDAGSLGNARDTALLARMRQVGLPFLCVLTKADMLAYDELPLAVAYLADQCAVPEALVFPVAAEIVAQGGVEPGVERLRTYLSNSVLPRAVAFREKALLAQAADIAAEFQGCVLTVKRSLEVAMSEVNEYRNSLLVTANAVTNDLCHAMADLVRSQLTLAVESSLRVRMNSSETLREGEFKEEMRHNLERVSEKAFLDTLAAQLEDRFQREWIEGIRAHADLLRRQLDELREAADKNATVLLEQMLAKENQKEEVVTSAVGSVAIGIGAALALVNPLAGIAAAAAAMLYGHLREQSTQPSQNAEREMQRLIEKWREEVVAEFVWQKFAHKLKEINLRVAEDAAQGYALRLPDWPLTTSELRHLLRECDERLARLEKVTLLASTGN